MYKWFFAWRYLHTKLIAFFGIASVTLCVAMVLVVLSVMGGFLDTIRTRSRGLTGDVILESPSLQGFAYCEEFGEYLKTALPDVVESSTPLIYAYGLFRVPATTYSKAPRVLGVRFDEYSKLTDFGIGLHYNKYYPGTTHLQPQAMPVVGIDEVNGVARLPTDLEAANQRWREQADPEELAEYLAAPFEQAPFPYVTPPFPAERVFSATYGEPMYDDPEFPGVIVGCDLLYDRRPDGNFDRVLARGTIMSLTLWPLSVVGNPSADPPVRLPLRYADDSRTGIYEIDSMCVYVDFDVLQKRLGMDPQPLVEGGFTKPRANQLLIDLKEGVDLNAGRDRIKTGWLTFCSTIPDQMTQNEAIQLAGVDAYTWEDLQRPFIVAVEKEKILMTILFGLISMVAIVLIGCIFYMIVEKKTRDVGILKSLGASPRGIAGIFFIYAAAVGVIGSILGVGIGSAFVWNINDIQDLLAQLNPALRVWSPDVYSFDKIPEMVKWADAIWVTSIAIVACMVGSLIPATIASRVWPVQALRYE